MSIEEAIRISISNAECLEKDGCLISASEARQLASWLQELKERREAEMRMVNRKQKEFKDPYLSPIPAPPICEATVIDGSEEINKALDKYMKKLENDADMYVICEMAKRWIESIQRKEESK